MIDDLKPLRVFLEVADQQSFSGAARTLGLTPASVTRIVAALEETTERQLLLRTTRQVSLTADGAALAARYRPIIAEFDAAGAALAEERRPDNGHIRLNAPLSFGMRLLPGLLAGFRLAYPRISLSVDLTDSLVDIMDGGCDLAIRISGPPEGKSTIWRKLCEVPRRLVAAPALFAHEPMPESPEALAQAPLLSYGSGQVAETWAFTSGARTHTLRAEGPIRTNNGDLLLSLAKSGEGIALLPDFLTADDLRSGALIHVLPEWSLPSLWLTLYYPPYETLPPLVATLSEYAETYLKEAQGMRFESQDA
ncbi:MAG: LysR family transcriptional regulator [Pseudomonadota bacterium]